LLVQVYV